MKLMIVDDEKYIVEYIKNLVNWAKYGFTTVLTFQNSILAMEKLEKEGCQLLISDIRMPEVTGIDLLKNIFESGSPTKVIFLSGHSEFEYAQKAIHYGASDYLLKPVTKKKLLEAVENVLSEIETESTDYLEEKEEGLSVGRISSLEEVLEEFIARSIQKEQLEPVWKLIWNEPFLFFKAPLNPFNAEILAGSAPLESLIDLYLSGMQMEEEECYAGMVPASAQASFLELNPYQEVVFSEEFYLDRLTQLKERYASFFQKKLSIGKGQNFLPTDERVVQSQKEVENVQVEDLNQEEEKKNQKIINVIQQYIDENLDEGLSLEDLSKIVYFHPAYLSRFYKQVTGEKLSDFIAKRRICRAKVLLKESNLRVADIAELVGYKKPQYFIKIFKLHCGVTPNQYRRKIIEGEL